MRLSTALLYILFAGLILSSCTQEASKKIPDVSDIEVDLNLIRYDQSLASIDSKKPQASYLKLLNKYPNMTDLYFKQLIGLYTDDEKKFYSNLAMFIEDERIKTLADTIAYSFKSTAKIEKDLEQMLRYVKHYFPGYNLPNIYTLFSEFSYQTFIFQDADNKDAIGVGLDFFLGSDFEYKRIDPANPAFSDYLTRSYNKEHLVKKVADMIIEDLAGEPNGKRFLDLIIYHGKKQYVLEQILPHTQDTILWEYTPQQMEWVSSNELQMWDYFLEQNLIYEASHLKTAKYIQPAPNSKGMPEVAPGRTGIYIGYKIIQAYLRRHPDTSLVDLLAAKDSQVILEKSRYKPARK